VSWIFRLGGMLAGLGLLFAASAASAQSAAEFYKGRPLTLYIGYGPGGGYDLYCRLLAKHMGKYLPGNPTVIPRNEPGAGSLKLANELYAVLPKDGSTIGMIGEVLVINQVLGDPAAKFAADEFNWIGRMADSDPVLVTAPNAPVKTFKDAQEKEVVIGVPGAGSSTFLNLTVAKNLFNTKFRLVSGYDGSAQVKLALERGEVQGSASTLWRVDRDWIRAGGYHPIYQASLDSAPDLSGVPTLASLARNDEERRLLRFFSSYTTIGRSILAPPKVPADRVKFLREAFDRTMKDPAFLADAKKGNIDLAVLSGDKLEALIRDASVLDDGLLAKAKRLSGTKAGQ
jgi:tripartite-type tricarboxylate transporter receptor subunit TctC